MELFLQFVSYQWYWFGALALLAAVLLRYEGGKAGPSIGTTQLTQLVNKNDAVIIDVRSKADYKQGHITDAVNLPYEQLAGKMDSLAPYKERPLIVVCKMGQHASAAAKQIRAAGFEQVYRLAGGMAEWTGSQLPVVKGK